MKSEPKTVYKEFNQASIDMIHGDYPNIDLFQLEPGPVKGWGFSGKVGSYHINAGSFDKVILYEGTYNKRMLHVGLILNPEHSAMVQAHKYNSGTMTINYGEIYMHEIFPHNMTWVNIFAPEKVLMDGINYSKEKLHRNPKLIIEGAQNELLPLIELVNAYINQTRIGSYKDSMHQESCLKRALHKLLAARFTDDVYEQPFIDGDIFRMQLLNRIKKLSLTNNNQPLSLDEICTAVKMKSRTVQKYFHEIYGMGPTEYFRIRRLNGVRTDLMNSTNLISDTAGKWGFTHFGRFSTQYKKLFNETPSSTRTNNVN